MVEGQHGHDLGGQVSAYSPAAPQSTATTHCQPAHLLGGYLVLWRCGHSHGRASPSGRGSPTCAPTQGSPFADSPSWQERVHLWIACVRNSALYGLHLVDLQQRHVTRITITLVKHLRAIARSFAHMSQESSQALLVRLQVEDPLQFLLRRSQNLLAQTRDSCDPMVARPRILNWLVHTTESKLALSSHLEPPLPSVPTASALPPDSRLRSLLLHPFPAPYRGCRGETRSQASVARVLLSSCVPPAYSGFPT